MKAMVLKAHGGTDGFALEEFPNPEVCSGHLLLKVSASSVNPVDYKIRQGLLKGTSEQPGDRIEAVIGLPEALFYNTGIPACVLVINKQKPANLKDKVIFIDASGEFAEGKNQNSLRAQDIDHIHEAHSAAFHNGVEEEKYCRLVPMGEIAGNDYNLNIARYIDTSVAEVPVDIAGVLGQLAVISGQLAVVDAELDGYLLELGFVAPSDSVEVA